MSQQSIHYSHPPETATASDRYRSGASPGPYRLRGWGEPLAVGLLALAVRAASLQHAPYVDELNHIMAAQSLLADGSLRLADGMQYTRGATLTYLIAALFRVFGESLTVARIPALIAGVLLVVVLFLWLRREDGSLSAWIAALLLALSPAAIYFSQQARFYSIQPLLVVLAAFAVYHVVISPRFRWPREGVLLMLAALTVWLAKSFQASALIGGAVIAAWAVGAIGLRWWGAGRRRDVAILGTFVTVTALAVAIIIALVPTAMQRVVRMATMADEWAAAGVAEPLFYFWHFERQYVVLLALFPLLALLALVRRERVAIFALTMFLVPVAIHSFLAWKHERYIAYAVPFLFVVVGLGVSQGVYWIFPALRDWLHLRTRGRVPTLAAGTVAAVLLVLAGLFLLRANLATAYATELIRGTDAEWQHDIAYRGEADWRAALPELRGPVADADVVISSIELKSMYYFGRQDVVLSRDYRAGGEFRTFWKMRRPVISTPASMRLLMSCVPTGIILVEERQWRRPWGVVDEVAELLERDTQRIPLPREARLHAFQWTGGELAGSEDCAVVEERVRGRVRG